MAKKMPPKPMKKGKPMPPMKKGSAKMPFTAKMEKNDPAV